MPTDNMDTAATVAELERSGFTAEQARGIAAIVAEADAGNQTQTRTIGASLAGFAVATAIMVAALA